MMAATEFSCNPAIRCGGSPGNPVKTRPRGTGPSVAAPHQPGNRGRAFYFTRNRQARHAEHLSKTQRGQPPSSRGRGDRARDSPRKIVGSRLRSPRGSESALGDQLPIPKKSVRVPTGKLDCFTGNWNQPASGAATLTRNVRELSHPGRVYLGYDRNSCRNGERAAS